MSEAAGLPRATVLQSRMRLAIRLLAAAAASLAAAVQHATRGRRALRHRDATLHALFEGLPDAVVVADTDRRIVRVNRAFERLFGWRADEVKGRSTEILYADPADYAALGRSHFAAHATGGDEPYRARYRRRDGSEFPGESRALRIEAGGRVVGLVGVHRDIGARLHAERDLQEARDRFALMFETAPSAMVFGELDSGRFIEINGAFEALSGRTRAQVIGRSSAEFGLWPDPAFRDRSRATLLGEGRIAHAETRLLHADGHEVDVLFTACRVALAGREHFIAMFIDIGAQQRARAELAAQVKARTAELEAANAELAASAAAVADLYDNAPCGYHSLAPDGTFVAVNATELALLGRTREEVLGQPLTRFFTPESAALFRERYAEFARSGEVRDLEYEIVRPDGSVVPVLVSAVMVRDAQGRHVSNRATMVDNGERKARERQIQAMQAELARRADAADAASRAKSAFLANMSHEIRTPMNAIIGLTHLLARESREPLQRSRLAKIDDAAHHLLEVINGILDLSKIEAGKMTLEEVEFALEDIVAKAVALVADRARAKGLELVTDTEGVPPRLRGDPTRLVQALVNLAGNAVKFTERGWVRLRVRCLRHEGARVQLRFEVRDTGPGIGPEACERLFIAFEQADASTTRRHGGTGLGLALTRRLAQLMQGEAGVESRVGEGSCFWFTAWLAQAPSAAPVPDAALRGCRVLLVDDLPESLHAMADRLRQFGLVVDAFTAPDLALAAARERPYALAVLDWRMQPLDGLELLPRLRELPGGTALPALLVTAYDDAQLWPRAQAAGFAAVLVKPVSPSTLLDAVRRLLVPAARTAAPAAAAAHAAEARLRALHAGRRVLLAEDSPVNQEVACDLLRAAGLVVQVAPDGHAAVDQALAEPFDAVLMDVQMPGLDGLQATRAIRTAGRGALPIIAMTANAFGEDRAACLAAGMDDHVAKPVEPEVLFAALLRWLPGGAGGAAAAEPSPEPAAQPLPLPDRLAAVEGLDVAAALRRVGGREPLLQRVLERFLQSCGQVEPMLDREQAHALRGAAATIGAEALAAELHALELLLQDPAAGPARVQRQRDAVAQAHASLLAQLRAVLGGGAS